MKRIKEKEREIGKNSQMIAKERKQHRKIYKGEKKKKTHKRSQIRPNDNNSNDDKAARRRRKDTPHAHTHTRQQ